ncbi:YybH family protein [Frigidibacter oleivorans]|uniref:YybH family protein n=1 Tax=Frigidibacter oleivorans TaxID=2487129 RepID=UPI000F8C8FA5|nr:SgcJ/EcaC family oxidoreductase [Frigidibacter oleivorans]
MSLPAPDTLPRVFAAAWGARDAEAIAALFAEDADLLTLTGAWAEGRAAIAAILAGELAGAFLRARLVTGRTKLRALGQDGAVLMQRFVLSGVRTEDGQDAGRIGTVLSAALQPGPEGWEIASASFCIES